ncbi:hypothetical protein [Spirosoma pollinicola]|uniref:Uncharacterized protein n=1 Tax=Spirosoma pollinicola TaxID=2057025 RepID=A0A2K8YTV3_9BACT|nr:hypothetical protein [Spirosoma pollinicola]AUD00988.1 hypothetical protein CWM47_03625 [Spirosoma pollinicola]
MILYSTNVFLKYHIQQKYFNDVHYVWCSELFDSKTASIYSPGSLVPPSSNPADIYRQLKADVSGGDSHSAKIVEQRASIIARATEWEINGVINSLVKDDIIYIATNGSINYWRPLIYVIPKAPLITRLHTVPASKCAGLGTEYIINDLNRAEFDIIEL